MSNGWIAVDLDGTLAYYDEWRGPTHIGAPVPAMVARVKRWLREGKDVRIFTARVCTNRPLEEVLAATRAIESWCLWHIGRKLRVTCTKDYGMVALYDDRCVQVEKNTGRLVATRKRGRRA